MNEVMCEARGRQAQQIYIPIYYESGISVGGGGNSGKSIRLLHVERQKIEFTHQFDYVVCIGVVE